LGGASAGSAGTSGGGSGGTSAGSGGTKSGAGGATGGNSGAGGKAGGGSAGMSGGAGGSGGQDESSCKKNSALPDQRCRNQSDCKSGSLCTPTKLTGGCGSAAMAVHLC